MIEELCIDSIFGGRKHNLSRLLITHYLLVSCIRTTTPAPKATSVIVDTSPRTICCVRMSCIPLQSLCAISVLQWHK